MQSKLIHVPSIDEVPLPERAPRDPRPEAERLLRSRLRTRSIQVEHTAVEPDDIVTVALAGDVPRFNRTTTIALGKGLFDPELELRLIGVPVGAPTQLAHSAGAVIATVDSAVGRRLPSPTPEIIQELTQNQYRTAEEFLAAQVERLRSQEHDGYIDRATYAVTDAMVRGSECRFAEEEIQAVVDHELERSRQLSLEEGMVFDAMTPDQLGVRVGQRSIADFITMLNGHARRLITLALLYCRFTGAGPGKFDLGTLQELSKSGTEYIRQHVAGRVPATP